MESGSGIRMRKDKQLLTRNSGLKQILILTELISFHQISISKMHFIDGILVIILLDFKPNENFLEKKFYV